MVTVDTIYIAQEEAKKALSLVKEVTEKLARIAPLRRNGPQGYLERDQKMR
jgi:hypothetical protein